MHNAGGHGAGASEDTGIGLAKIEPSAIRTLGISDRAMHRGHVRLQN
jgi:hypothetical protein